MIDVRAVPGARVCHPEGARLFSSWLSTAKTVAEVMPGGQARCPTSNSDAFALHGRKGNWVVVNNIAGEVICMNDRHNRRERTPPAGPLK